MADIRVVEGFEAVALAGKASLGKTERKKDLPEIVAAHGVPYVATASVAYLGDLKQKVKKAMTLHGPRYIQIDTPCPSVWNFPSHLTLEVGRLGVNCGPVPLSEMLEGKISRVKKLRGKVPVIEYLKQQKRFQHLVVNEASKRSLMAIQEQADRNVEKYQLMG